MNQSNKVLVIKYSLSLLREATMNEFFISPKLDYACSVIVEISLPNIRIAPKRKHKLLVDPNTLPLTRTSILKTYKALVFVTVSSQLSPRFGPKWQFPSGWTNQQFRTRIKDFSRILRYITVVIYLLLGSGAPFVRWYFQSCFRYVWWVNYRWSTIQSDSEIVEQRAKRQLHRTTA